MFRDDIWPRVQVSAVESRRTGPLLLLPNKPAALCPPPVYRPALGSVHRPAPCALQPKANHALRPAPPVYRPAPPPEARFFAPVTGSMTRSVQAQPATRPAAPPVYRPTPITKHGMRAPAAALTRKPECSTSCGCASCGGSRSVQRYPSLPGRQPGAGPAMAAATFHAHAPGFSRPLFHATPARTIQRAVDVLPAQTVDLASERSVREQHAIERGMGAALGDCEELFRRLKKIAEERGTQLTNNSLPQVSPHGTLGTGQGRAEGHEERTGKIVSDWKEALLNDFFKLTGIRAKSCTDALNQLNKLASAKVDKDELKSDAKSAEHSQRLQQQASATAMSKSLGGKSREQVRKENDSKKAAKKAQNAAKKKAAYEASDKAQRDRKRR